jgi:uncharacterized protein YceK
MKILMLALAMCGLLVGCASHNDSTGGTSDQTEYNNNATHGTGTSTATNSGFGTMENP